jgi:hypothetical protein
MRAVDRESHEGMRMCVYGYVYLVRADSGEKLPRKRAMKLCVCVEACVCVYVCVYMSTHTHACLLWNICKKYLRVPKIHAIKMYASFSSACARVCRSMCTKCMSSPQLLAIQTVYSQIETYVRKMLGSWRTYIYIYIYI